MFQQLVLPGSFRMSATGFLRPDGYSSHTILTSSQQDCPKRNAWSRFSQRPSTQSREKREPGNLEGARRTICARCGWAFGAPLRSPPISLKKGGNIPSGGGKGKSSGGGGRVAGGGKSDGGGGEDAGGGGKFRGGGGEESGGGGENSGGGGELRGGGGASAGGGGLESGGGNEGGGRASGGGGGGGCGSDEDKNVAFRTGVLHLLVLQSVMGLVG
jgi:hypothetical protein